jgi:hypothetical protein
LKKHSEAFGSFVKDFAAHRLRFAEQIHWHWWAAGFEWFDVRNTKLRASGWKHRSDYFPQSKLVGWKTQPQ